MTFENVVFITYIFTGIAVILVFASLIQKIKHDRYYKKVDHARNFLLAHYIDHKPVKLRVSKRFFFDALIDVDEQIHLDDDLRSSIIRDFEKSHFIKKMKRRLNSWITYRRKIAIFYVARLRNEEAYQLLKQRFMKEKTESVKILIINNLKYGMDLPFLHQVMDSFVGASKIYQKRLATVLGANLSNIYEIFPSYMHDTRHDIIKALIRMSAFKMDSNMTVFMLEQMKMLVDKKQQTNEDIETLEAICKSLMKHSPEFLFAKSHLKHPNKILRLYAIKSYRYKNITGAMDELMASFDKSELDNERVETLSYMVFHKQHLLDDLLKKFPTYDIYQKERITAILNERLEYIILKLFHNDEDRLREILSILLDQMMIESLIAFTNHNKDEDLKIFLLKLIKNHIGFNNLMEQQFRLYLHETLLTEIGLTKLEPERKKRERPPIETTKIRWIYRWIIISLLLFPCLYIGLNFQIFANRTFGASLRGYVVHVNIYIIFYYATINMIYFLLLTLSFIGSRRQVGISKTRKNTLLFSEKLMPGISIIAPAYNESLSIIESVTSLLNLKYPDYEVIVVNDGSKDNTLDILIEHFELERKHAPMNLTLNTNPIRDVYRTKHVPNLIVVDKENGGKADALNVGINVSSKKFVCGIDADSILEGDALLKLASVMLDDTDTYVALGGNIYPANGFKFDKGKAEYRGIPKENVERFQTIEYLRAFTSGRIGWSMMKSLMIISGAFGLFKKDLLIETGGYLTSNSRFKKDTVGEDMELVVRLTRQALEKKEKFRVKYVYNAYCYTELPSDLGTLLKQRNRWQRGLIDILSYHRKIGFKPKYKQIGLIGYPYFFIFEFLGPFFETQGYVMLLIGLIFGWLNISIVLAIFAVSILFGVVISLSSIFMSEREIKMMKMSELLVMLGYAILENFGYRQMISLHRMISTVHLVQ